MGEQRRAAVRESKKTRRLREAREGCGQSPYLASMLDIPPPICYPRDNRERCLVPDG